MRVVLTFIFILFSFGLFAADVPDAPFVVYGQVLDSGKLPAKGTKLTFTAAGKEFPVSVVLSETGVAYYKLMIPAESVKGVDTFDLKLDKYGDTYQSASRNGLKYPAKFIEWNIHINSSAKDVYSASLVKSYSFKETAKGFVFAISFDPPKDTDAYIKNYEVRFYAKTGDKVTSAGSTTVDAASGGTMSAAYTLISKTAPDGGYFVISPAGSDGGKLFAVQLYKPLQAAQTY